MVNENTPHVRDNSETPETPNKEVQADVRLQYQLAYQNWMHLDAIYARFPLLYVGLLGLYLTRKDEILSGFPSAPYWLFTLGIPILLMIIRTRYLQETQDIIIGRLSGANRGCTKERWLIQFFKNVFVGIPREPQPDESEYCMQAKLIPEENLLLRPYLGFLRTSTTIAIFVFIMMSITLFTGPSTPNGSSSPPPTSPITGEVP